MRFEGNVKCSEAICTAVEAPRNVLAEKENLRQLTKCKMTNNLVHRTLSTKKHGLWLRLEPLLKDKGLMVSRAAAKLIG
jgi:hypothetical protein